MDRVCLQLLMIARRIPQVHAVAYTPRDATQQVPLQQTVIYSTEGREKTLRAVVAALGNTHQTHQYYLRTTLKLSSAFFLRLAHHGVN